MILRPVMVADDRSQSVGIPHKDSRKDQAHVTQHAVDGDPVFPRILKKLHIVEHPHEGHGNFRHEFRGSVDAAFKKGPSVPYRLYQLKKAAVLSAEIDDREHASHKLADPRGHRRTGESPAKHDNKQRIQQNIAEACTYGDGKSKPRLFRRHEEQLERIGQDPEGQRQDEDPSVQHTVFQEFSFRPQKGCEGRHKDKSRHHHTDAKEEGHQDQQGKQAVRPFRLLFPQCLCNQRAAAYAEHIPDGTQDVQRRHNHTDGREFRLAHKPGDKESVHNNIQGQEYVHHDGGQRKTQQFTVIKTF